VRLFSSDSEVEVLCYILSRVFDIAKFVREGEVVTLVEVLNLVDPGLLVVRGDESDEDPCSKSRTICAEVLKTVNSVAHNDKDCGNPVEQDWSQHGDVGEQNEEPVDEIVVLNEEPDEPQKDDRIPD